MNAAAQRNCRIKYTAHTGLRQSSHYISLGATEVTKVKVKRVMRMHLAQSWTVRVRQQHANNKTFYNGYKTDILPNGVLRNNQHQY